MTPEAARELIAKHGDLMRSIDAFEAMPETFRWRAVQSVEAIRKEAALQRAAEIPVARLKDTAKGLRLDALDRAGYRTVADLAVAEVTWLTRLPGVGETTGRQAIAAARQVLEATELSTVIRFEVDRRPPSQTALLSALRSYDISMKALPEAEPMMAWARESLTGLPSQIEPATRSWAKRLFTKSATKTEAERAAERLREVLAHPSVPSLSAYIGGTVEAVHRVRTADETWQDYERNAAQLLGLLAEVTGAGNDPAARGFLPEEIVRQVEAMSLDLRHLTASLRGYQAFGAKYALVQQRTIVGDEMGLGKTVEALAAICHLKAIGHDTAVVVCPASVVANWRSEIRRHTELDCHVLHGPDRDWALRNWQRIGGVAVTTFDGARRLDPHVTLAGRKLGMLVVDEAHYVKNPAAKRSQAVAAWATAAGRVLFLTGTPMENRVEEFQALIAHLQPEVAARVTPAAALAGPQAFQTLVAPAYLRRNQTDVLEELPEMIQALEWNDSTRADDLAYRAAVERRSFMAMRRAAYESAPVTSLNSLSAVERSAKLARLVDIAQEAAAENLKIVVFSYFRDVLETVTAALRLALPESVLGPLTGSTPPPERQRLVDELTQRHGGAALVAQIEAGGVGLNIQAASVVVLCEPQWKPTVESQAIARCHRMGQVRRVQVHRLLLEDTVDERMLEVLAGKRQLIDQFVTDSVIKEASTQAIDISDLATVDKVVDEAAAEAAIIEWELRRLRLADAAPADADGAQTT